MQKKAELYAASEEGYDKIVKLLLSRDADIHTYNKTFSNALYTASTKKTRYSRFQKGDKFRMYWFDLLPPGDLPSQTRLGTLNHASNLFSSFNATK
jgi:ankyrin repeat protein